MKSTFSCIACLVPCAALLLFTGCSGGDPKTVAKGKLVGTWKAELEADEDSDVELAPESMSMEIKFQDDGTMTMEMPLMDDPVSGTWEVTAAEEKKVTIHTVLKMPSFEFSGDGEGNETTKIEYNEDPQDFSIVFETDDRITMTPTDDEDPMTFDRQ